MLREEIKRVLESKENAILEALSAKEGEINSRQDLERYVFNCSTCHKTKPATELVVVEYPLEIDSTTKIESKIVVITQKLALICKECQNAIKVNVI